MDYRIILTEPRIPLRDNVLHCQTERNAILTLRVLIEETEKNGQNLKVRMSGPGTAAEERKIDG